MEYRNVLILILIFCLIVASPFLVIAAVVTLHAIPIFLVFLAGYFFLRLVFGEDEKKD